MATNSLDTDWKGHFGDLWRLGGLWVLTVAEPVLAVLRQNPEVLMARPGSPTTSALIAVIALGVLAPIGLWAGVLSFRLAGQKIYRAAYRLVMGVLAAGFCMQLVHTLHEGLAWIAASVAFVAGIAVYAWIRRPAPCFVANVLGVAVLVSPAVFLMSPRVADHWQEAEFDGVAVEIASESPPVIFVLFDEFQLASLLDQENRINAALYPNLAAFAGNATWYRNARSVSSGTLQAVPSLLTGKMPEAEATSPIMLNHPSNLFTLIGRSMNMHVLETLTRLCPPALCPQKDVPLLDHAAGLLADAAAIFLHEQLPSVWSGWLPDIDKTWGGFWQAGTALFPGGWLETAQQAVSSDRKAQFYDWLERIEAHADTLHFLHTPLPHVPLVYYPDGRRYPSVGLYHAPDQAAVDDEWAVLRAYQRHVLQTVFMDRLIGDLVARLKALGIYDSALVVLTADHGVYYGPGILRRAITEQSADDVLRVPLIIKSPGQRQGLVDDRLVYTIDIVPTILDLLGAPVPDDMDGRSLVREPARSEALPAIDARGHVHASPLGPGLAGAFDAGGVIPRLSHTDSMAGLYRLGPYAGLVGRDVSQLNLAREAVAAEAVWLREREAIFAAPYSRDEVPGFILGVYRPGGESFHAALALDREIVATTHSYIVEEDQKRIRFLVPPEIFDNSIEHIQIFRIEADASEQLLLVPIYDQSRS